MSSILTPLYSPPCPRQRNLSFTLSPTPQSSPILSQSTSSRPRGSLSKSVAGSPSPFLVDPFQRPSPLLSQSQVCSGTSGKLIPVPGLVLLIYRSVGMSFMQTNASSRSIMQIPTTSLRRIRSTPRCPSRQRTSTRSTQRCWTTSRSSRTHTRRS